MPLVLNIKPGPCKMQPAYDGPSSNTAASFLISVSVKNIELYVALADIEIEKVSLNFVQICDSFLKRNRFFDLVCTNLLRLLVCQQLNSNSLIDTKIERYATYCPAICMERLLRLLPLVLSGTRSMHLNLPTS